MFRQARRSDQLRQTTCRLVLSRRIAPAVILAETAQAGKVVSCIVDLFEKLGLEPAPVSRHNPHRRDHAFRLDTVSLTSRIVTTLQVLSHSVPLG